LDNYDISHWNAVKRIFKYLKETLDYGITYRNNGSIPKLEEYSDFDYAADIDTRRSTSGYIFKIMNSPVTWNSKRQATVSLSTTEVEYIVASLVTKEQPGSEHTDRSRIPVRGSNSDYDEITRAR